MRWKNKGTGLTHMCMYQQQIRSWYKSISHHLIIFFRYFCPYASENPTRDKNAQFGTRHSLFIYFFKERFSQHLQHN